MPTFNPDTKYLFIDGGYLRSLLERFPLWRFDGESPEIDFRKLSSGFHKTFYYDAPPARKSGESEQDYRSRAGAREAFLSEMRKVPGLHVFLGRTVGNGGKARQKGVDVLIAVHMLLHATRRNANRLTLLAGDADFKPLVEALVQEGVDVTLWYSAGHASEDFIYAADNQRELTNDVIHNACSNELLRKSPLPSRTSWSGPLPLNDYKRVGQGKLRSGEKIFKLEGPKGGFLAIVRGTEHFDVWQHPSLAFLVKWHEESHEPILWDDHGSQSG